MPNFPRAKAITHNIFRHIRSVDSLSSGLLSSWLLSQLWRKSLIAEGQSLTARTKKVRTTYEKVRMPIAVKALRGVGSDPATTVFLRDGRGPRGRGRYTFCEALHHWLCDRRSKLRIEIVSSKRPSFIEAKMCPMFVTPLRFQRRRQTHQFPPRQSLQSHLSRCPWGHQLQARSRLGRTPDSGSPGETHLSQGYL